jgi:hypothetical protein
VSAGVALEWPSATARLPVASAMAGGVQPRGRDGVELLCLVCGELFMALRVDRRTCSPTLHRDGRSASQRLHGADELGDARPDCAHNEQQARAYHRAGDQCQLLGRGHLEITAFGTLVR